MAHLLYKIYYSAPNGDFLAYLGRTNQPLKRRLHGHFFKKSFHKMLDPRQVSRIEYAEFPTEADMFLYEVYYINKFKPPFNRDDKAKDDLTVSLPDVAFQPFECDLMEKWCSQLDTQDRTAEKLRKQRLNGLCHDLF